jgi:hypothetical protein
VLVKMAFLQSPNAPVLASNWRRDRWVLECQFKRKGLCHDPCDRSSFKRDRRECSRWIEDIPAKRS